MVLNLALLGVVAGLGRQQESLFEVAGTILFGGVIGELIASAIWAQKRQRSVLEQLHAGLRPLLEAQTEQDAARLVSELAVHVLRADGVLSLILEPEDATGQTMTARGGAGGGADYGGVTVSVNNEQSGAGIAARTRRHLFVPDAPHSPLVSQQYVARYSAASILYVPILVGDRLIGVMVMWWTAPISDLDRFTDQVLELLSIQAGPVLERVRQVEDLDRAATTDSLTGVLNRRAFEHGMAHLAEDAVLLLFDLDRFKALNDSQGHPAGDRVLRSFAAALARSVRESDLVCRIGGDEFAVIASGEEKVAQAMLERLEAVWTSPEDVGFSAGYALRRPGEAPDALNARADEALYTEKNRRRGRARIS
nr:sensor domain-containing diguanylate cyclase [Kineosporia babensis]